MDFIDSVVATRAWPAEQLTINLSTTAAVVSAEVVTKFRVLQGYINNPYDDQLLMYAAPSLTPTPLVPQTEYVVPLFPYNWGYTLTWDVSGSDMVYGRFVVNSADVCTIYPSRTVAQLLSCSTFSATISTVNTTATYSNIPSLTGVVADAPTPIRTFADYWAIAQDSLVNLTTTNPETSGAVRLSYDIDGRTTKHREDVYTATALVTELTANATFYPIMPQTLIVTTYIKNSTEDELVVLRDDTGTLVPVNRHGAANTAISGTQNLTTGQITLQWLEDYALDVDRVITLSYSTEAAQAGATAVDASASMVNHKDASMQTLNTFYAVASADYVTMVTTVPIYMCEVDISVDGGAGSDTYPVNGGFQLQFKPWYISLTSATAAFVAGAYTDTVEQCTISAVDPYTLVRFASGQNTDAVSVYDAGTLLPYNLDSGAWVAGTTVIGLSAPEGSYVTGSMSLSLSSNNGAVDYDVEVPWVIGQPTLYPVITSATNRRAGLIVDTDIGFAATDEIIWTASPIHNLEMYSNTNGERVQWGTASKWLSASDVYVENLGVQPTQLCVQSVSTSQSGCTVWIPQNYNNVSLRIHVDAAKFDNLPYTRTLPLSAFVSKNGFDYPPPYDSTITWSITPSPNLTSWGTNVAYNRFEYGVPQLSTLANEITANWQTPFADQNPKWRTTSITAEVVSPKFTRTSTAPVIVQVDDYPSPALQRTALQMHVSSVNVGVTSMVVDASENNYDIITPYGGVHDLCFETHTIEPFDRIPYEMYWLVNGQVTPITASNSLPVSSWENNVMCMTISATSPMVCSVDLCMVVEPPTWQARHLICDNIDLRFYGASPSMTAVAYPSVAWDVSGGATALTTNNWVTYTQGVSSIGECHGTILTISAYNPPASAIEPSLSASGECYDSFLFRIGDKWVLQDSSTLVTRVTSQPDQVYTAYMLGVTAFNQQLPSTMQSTTSVDISGNLQQLHTTTTTAAFSALTATPFPQRSWWHDLVITPYATPTISISSDQAPILEMGFSPVIYIGVNITVDVPAPQVVTKARGSLTWDTPTGITTTRVNLNQGENTFVQMFQTSDRTKPYFLDLTTASPITIALTQITADTAVITPPFDWCKSTKSLGSVTELLTAYPSPIVDLFDAARVVCAGDELTFTNSSTSTLDTLDFDQLLVDYGNGTTEVLPTSSAELTATYNSAGIYYITVTGQYLSGDDVERVFGPVVVRNAEACDQPIASYDPDITRQLGDTLQLPYPCEGLAVDNDWGTADVINSVLGKLQANNDYILDACTIYDPNQPFAFVGWFGGLISYTADKWHTNQQSKMLYKEGIPSWVSNSVSALLWDAQTEKVFTIWGGSRINVHSYSPTMQLLQTTTEVSTGTTFSSPVALAINSQRKIFVLDKDLHTVFVFDIGFLPDEPLVLDFYAGGAGTEADPSKFYYPTDLHVDANDDVWVVDAGNMVVRHLNNSLSELAVITNEDWAYSSIRPHSVTTDSGKLLVSHGTSVVVFDAVTYAKVNTIQLPTTYPITKLLTDPNQPGFVVALAGGEVHKFTIDGLWINTFTDPKLSTGAFVAGCYNGAYELMLTDGRLLYLAIDYPTTKTTRSTKMDSSMWDVTEFAIDREELVTDWVYNDAFTKLWDNTVMLARSIYSKMVTYIDGVQDTFKLQQLEPMLSVELPDETAPADLLVGVNEVVSSDVIVRAAVAVCELQQQVLLMAQQTIDRLPCDGAICWTWKAMRGTNIPSGRNCDGNPLTWFELQSNNQTSFAKHWTDAIGCGNTIFQPIL